MMLALKRPYETWSIWSLTLLQVFVFAETPMLFTDLRVCVLGLRPMCRKYLDFADKFSL